jgi:hypothetical protein
MTGTEPHAWETGQMNDITDDAPDDCCGVGFDHGERLKGWGRAGLDRHQIRRW